MNSHRTFSRRTLVSLAGASAFSLKPVLLGSDAEPQRSVAITIDDGPASGAGDDLNSFQTISAALRQIFLDESVPVTMFVNERQLHVSGQRDARIKVVEDWIAAGLDLGNHTFSHRRLRGAALDEFFDDVIKGEVVSRQLLSAQRKPLRWFRYPYLSSDEGKRAAAVEEFLTQRDYAIAPVTVDYKDYSFASNYQRFLRAGDTQQAEELLASVLRAVDNAFEYSETKSNELLGYELPQVLLIHCNQMNALTLNKAIEVIRNRGYRFVSLDQAMQDPAYRTPGLPPGSLGGGFFSGLQQALAS